MFKYILKRILKYSLKHVLKYILINTHNLRLKYMLK